ncbi:MAG: hypothetical protein AAGH41_14635, partial [Pseudomonadota bacterium]
MSRRFAMRSRPMANARSIKYQMAIAKPPLAKEIKEIKEIKEFKEIKECDFEAAEVNETLVRDLATGDFL